MGKYRCWNELLIGIVAPEHARARKMPVQRQIFGALACAMLDFSFSSMREPG